MNHEILKFRITFIEPLLGAQSTKQVASDFIATKFVENGGELPEDEEETLPEKLERGTTVFHKDEQGRPMLFNYQVKGFFKEAGRIFNGLNGVKSLRSKIENYVFVYPRRIYLNLPNGLQTIEYLERPLRAETAQGPRIALARSEMAPAGTWFDAQLKVLEGPIDSDLLAELATYGEDKGLGQWRNGGWGSFSLAWQK